MRQKLVVGFISAVAFAPPAFADRVTIVSNGSGIAALTFAQEGTVVREQTYPFTVDDTNVATVSTTLGSTSATASASITSDLSDPSRLRSSGSTTVSYETTTGGGEASSTSDFFVFFLLDVPHEYRFTADFATSGGTISTPVMAEWSKWLVHFLAMNPDMSQASAVMIEQGNDSAALRRSGVLGSGLYRFNVNGTAFAANFVEGPASGSAFSNFTFSLDLTAVDNEPAPVPEPASLLLIGTGLGGVIAARCRKRIEERRRLTSR